MNIDSLLTPVRALRQISLNKISPDDCALLNSYNIKENFIQQNFVDSTPVAQDLLQSSNPPGVYLEDYHSFGMIRPFQISALINGSVHARCPFTGSSLSSNTSFPVVSEGFTYVFYLFHSIYPFFLVAGGHTCVRCLMVFPTLSLLVTDNDAQPQSRPVHASLLIDIFNSCILLNADSVLKYILSQQRKTALAAQNFPHLSWAVISGYAGLFYLHEKNLWHLVQCLVLQDVSYASLESLFPGLNIPTIKGGAASDIFQKSISDNLFVLQLSAYRLSEIFCKYIAMISQSLYFKNLPTAVLKLKKLRETGTPIMCINLRTDKRVWINQRDGLLTLIQSTMNHYPDLCVIFDGYTSLDESEMTPDIARNVEEQTQIVNYIAAKSSCNFINVIGLPLLEKIGAISHCNLYVLGYGAAITVPYILRLPTVIHSSAAHAINQKIENESQLIREENILPIVISSGQQELADGERHIIKDNLGLSVTSHYNSSYDIDGTQLLQGVLRILRSCVSSRL
jgi:hypothetical protein